MLPRDVEASQTRGPAAVVPLATEPAPRIVIDPPIADWLAQGRVVIQYRAENLRIVTFVVRTWSRQTAIAEAGVVKSFGEGIVPGSLAFRGRAPVYTDVS